MSAFPPGHRYAHHENAFLQALSSTWNSIAPARPEDIRVHDAVRTLVFGGHIREFGNLTAEQLAAWEDLVTSGHKQLGIARKLARSIL